MTVYHCIDQFVKVNFMATYEKNPFFSGFRIFYWAVFNLNSMQIQFYDCCMNYIIKGIMQ